MKLTVVGEVISICKKVSKGPSGREYNLVKLGLPGFEKYQTFLPEEAIPDFLEGSQLEIDFEVSFPKVWECKLSIVGWRKF